MHAWTLEVFSCRACLLVKWTLRTAEIWSDGRLDDATVCDASVERQLQK